MRTRLSNSNLFQKTSDRILRFLQEGITPEKMALALAFGITLGIIPLLGATTLLCALVAFVFRLNQPFIQLVHYVVSPIQLLLYIPFLKIGTGLFSDESFNYSLDEITQMLANDLWHTMEKFFLINLYGLLLWLIIVPVLFILSYVAGVLVFKMLSKRFEKETPQ